MPMVSALQELEKNEEAVEAVTFLESLPSWYWDGHQ